MYDVICINNSMPFVFFLIVETKKHSDQHISNDSSTSQRTFKAKFSFALFYFIFNDGQHNRKRSQIGLLVYVCVRANKPKSRHRPCLCTLFSRVGIGHLFLKCLITFHKCLKKFSLFPLKFSYNNILGTLLYCISELA